MSLVAKKPQIRNYQMTKYPKIYNNCYWGHHSYSNQNDIINNRNLFIEEFNINKHAKNAPAYIKNQINPEDYFRLNNNRFISSNKKEKIEKFFSDNNIKEFYMDHIEYYQSDDYYIGIFNNYYLKDEDKENAINFGYEVYDKCLYNDCTTMIKKIAKCIGYKNTNHIYRNI